MAEQKKQRKTPYLHVREGEGALLPWGYEIVGNAVALLQLRRQIDRALRDQLEGYPIDENIYQELTGELFEVVVRRAASRGEMQPQVPREAKPGSGEQKPWAHRARDSVQERRDNE